MGIEQSFNVIEVDHYRMIARTSTLANEITSLEKKHFVTYPDKQFLS